MYINKKWLEKTKKTCICSNLKVEKASQDETELRKRPYGRSRENQTVCHVKIERGTIKVNAQRLGNGT